MSIYFIEDPDGVIYQLDATVNITYKISGKGTDNPVESGESVTDNYVNRPDIITLKGSISDTKSVSGGGTVSKSTEDYITGLKALKEKRKRVSLHFGDKVGVITNCLFQSIDFTQNSRRGNAGAGVDSFEVTISLKQIRLAARAQLKPLRVDLVADDFADETEGGGSPSTLFGQKETLVTTAVKLITNK
jgi:hypothetical protein